jgi:hypothetical protein
MEAIRSSTAQGRAWDPMLAILETYLKPGIASSHSGSGKAYQAHFAWVHEGRSVFESAYGSARHLH